MSGSAVAVERYDTVQLVTGRTPEESWREYDTDLLFSYTADVLSRERGDSLSFLFAATEHSYEVPKELVIPGTLP